MSSPLELPVRVSVDTDEAADALAGLAGAAEGAGDSLTEAMDGASASIENLGREGSKSGRAIQGFAAVLGLIDPRAAAAARSVATLARGMSFLKLGLGPVAVGIAAVTGAVALYSAEQDRKVRIEANAKTVSDTLAASEDRLRAAYEDLAAAASETGRREQALLNVRRAAFAESLPGFQELARQISETRMELDRYEDVFERFDGAGDAITNVVGTQTVLAAVAWKVGGLANDRADEAAQRLRDLRAAQTQLVDNLREEAKVRTEALQIQFDEADAAKATATAKTRATDDAKRLAEAEALRAEVMDLVASAEGEGISAAEKVNQLYAERVARLDEIQQRAGGTADLEDAYAAVAKARDRELYELRAQYIADLAAKQQAADDEAKRRREEERQETISTISEIGDFYGSLAGIAEQVAQAKGETDKRAAQRALNTAKRLALAEATLARSVGISNVFASTVGRPIARAIGIAAQVAAFAEQAAAIGSTSLHQGGLAPDEQRMGSTVVLRDEARTADGRVISPEGTRRMERGEDAVRVVTFEAYQTFGRFFPGYILGNSTPLTASIKGSKTTGHTGRY
jgi:uncharacterized phage infection (PIP) family protein YhgE